MLADFQNYIKNHNLFHSDEKVLLGVSGGIDSVFMAQLFHKAGYRFGVITLRSSQILKIRAAELGIEIVRQGAGDKLRAAHEILDELHLAPRQACYIGDDLPDVPVVRAVGLGVAVADAAVELRQAADHVTTAAGGAGAVREIIEIILKAQRRWDEVIQPYLA